MNKQVTIGTTFHWHFADGKPLWKVIRSRGAGVWVCEIVSEDFKGSQQVYTSEQIIGSLQSDDFWQKLTKHHDDWFESLPLGTIIHYRDGMNQFVRCEVVEAEIEGKLQKCVVSIALVGSRWGKHDLPRRMSNGTINYPYHAKYVVEKTPHTINPSNFYEYQITQKDSQNDTNPHELEPISLELPEMTEEEKHLANNYNKAQEIIDLLNEQQVTDDMLANVAYLINTYLE